MKLAVVIVSYNVKYYLEQCLYSLRKALDGTEAQVYVVDNDSADDSVAYLSSRFADVQVMESGGNVGFSRANNLAIRASHSEYVLLLNPDTLVGEETIRQALAFMDAHPRAGALGVKMLNTDGSVAKESRRGIPSPMTAFYKMCGLCDRYPNNRKLAHYYMSYLPWDRPAQIEVLSGAFFLARRAALDEVGLLDEDFFMYGEDIDLSYRIHRHGWQVWYYPAEILHYKGESTQKTSFRYVHVFYQAMLIFFQKHYSHLSFLFSLPIRLAIYSKALSALLHIQLGRVHGHVRTVGSHGASEEYQFVVSRGHEPAVRAIAARYQLRATYVDSLDALNLDAPDGDRLRYVVFDLGCFGYSQIFRIFATGSHPRVRMAFFWPQSQMVITEHKIFPPCPICQQ